MPIEIGINISGGSANTLRKPGFGSRNLRLSQLQKCRVRSLDPFPAWKSNPWGWGWPFEALGCITRTFKVFVKTPWIRPFSTPWIRSPMESSKRCVLLPDLLGNQSFDANSQQPYQTNIIVICGVTDRTNYIYIYIIDSIYIVCSWFRSTVSREAVALTNMCSGFGDWLFYTELLRSWQDSWILGSWQILLQERTV